MRKILLLAWVPVAILSLGSRYGVVMDSGLPAAGPVIENDWAHAFLGGLIPPSAEATVARCEAGIARVETRISLPNLLATLATAALYSPMTIRAWCAAPRPPEIELLVRHDTVYLAPPPVEEPPLPAPAAPAEPQLLLEDDFDAENGGRPTLRHDAFKHWRVLDGSVDLVGAGSSWDFLPGNGLYVDLDGHDWDRNFDAGRLESRESFLLEPGRYRLEFDLAGSQRGDVNSVVVALGEVLREEITLPSDAPFTRYEYTIRVRERTHGTLSFDHAGGDGYGLLLDRVKLSRLP